MGMSADDYRTYLAGPGKEEYEAAHEDRPPRIRFSACRFACSGASSSGATIECPCSKDGLRSAGLALENAQKTRRVRRGRSRGERA